MRLYTAARADLNKVAVHIHNLREIRITTEHSWFQVRRITVALGVYFSNDAVGLLEITN
jgi:hypothetical protein